MNTRLLEFIQQLRLYESKFLHEDVTASFIDLVKSQPHCFSRNCYADGHITASAWIFNQNRDKCLLTKHRKLRKWLQLGGHLEADESPLCAAAREASEESGLPIATLSSEIMDLDIHYIPANEHEPPHRHYDVRFLMTARDDVLLHENNLDTETVRWIPLQDVSTYTTEQSIHRLMQKTNDVRFVSF